jgi:hypothetical protein
MKEPEHPICQSCSMPIDKPFNFGTDKDGYHIIEFCRYCYKRGKFTEPQITLEQMIEKVAGIRSKAENVPLEQAKKTVTDTIRGLARWRK